MAKALIPAPKTMAVFVNPKNHDVAVSWGMEDAKALFDFKATYGKSSWTTYEVGLRNFFGFCKALGLRSPRQVEITHITSYIDWLKNEEYAKRTINNYLSAASAFFDFMMQPRDTAGTALIKSNPFHSIKKARPKVEPYEQENDLRRLSIEEYRAMLRACDRTTVLGKRDYAILRLAFNTTRRRQEIVKLRVLDFGKDGRIPFVKFRMKGDKTQAHDLSPTLMAEIEDYWRASGRKLRPESPAFVATTDAGKHLLKARGLRVREGEGPLAPSALDQMVKKRGREAGLDGNVVHLHMHGIRHLAAKALRESGMDVKEIKERLGHESLKTTDIYLGAMDRITADGWEKREELELGEGSGSGAERRLAAPPDGPGAVPDPADASAPPQRQKHVQ